MRTLMKLTAALVLLGACGEDALSPDEGDSQLANGSMSARIDGEAWSATAALAVGYTGGILAFAGSDASQVTIGVGFIPDGLKTYPIGPSEPTNGNLTLGSTESWAASSSMGSGTVTLTSFTANSASGTFTFIAEPVSTTGATGTRSLTEGVFDVTF